MRSQPLLSTGRKKNNFFAERDEAGNVLIRKPATAGMEKSQPVVLQAHLDMVPQANEGNPHNFVQDPIRPYIDGDWVKHKVPHLARITVSA